MLKLFCLFHGEVCFGVDLQVKLVLVLSNRSRGIFYKCLILYSAIVRTLLVYLVFMFDVKYKKYRIRYMSAPHMLFSL